MFLLKKRYWLVLTLLLTLLLALKDFPATWTIYAIQQAVPGFQTSGINGSLFHGDAQYSQWVNRGNTLVLGEFKWSLRISSLLMLAPCANFYTQTSVQVITGEACYSIFKNKVEFNKVNMRLPLSQISAFFEPDLSGVIDAYIEHAAWQNQQLSETSLKLSWQQAAVFNDGFWLPLGSIQGHINDDGQGGLSSQWSHIEHSQQSGSLPIKMDLRATMSNLASTRPSIHVTGNVTPARDNAVLKQVLSFIAEPLDDGSYRIDIKE